MWLIHLDMKMLIRNIQTGPELHKHVHSSSTNSLSMWGWRDWLTTSNPTFLTSKAEVKMLFYHIAVWRIAWDNACISSYLRSHYKESWVPKNGWFWTVVLEKTLESPLDCKQIQPVHPKENPPWIYIGRTDGEAETPILWPPDSKNWLIGKDPDAGIDSRQEEKGMTEDEMVGRHHQLDGHEFE